MGHDIYIYMATKRCVPKQKDWPSIMGHDIFIYVHKRMVPVQGLGHFGLRMIPPWLLHLQKEPD